MHTSDLTTDVVLRFATNADIPGIIDLINDVLPDYGHSVDLNGVESDLRDIEESYFAQGGAFWVLAQNETRIIGSAGVVPIDKQHIELRKMYVDHRHRRRGYGRQLLTAALQMARERAFQYMTLQTMTAMKEARALYSRYGFSVSNGATCSSRCEIAMQCDLRQEFSLPIDT